MGKRTGGWDWSVAVIPTRPEVGHIHPDNNNPALMVMYVVCLPRLNLEAGPAGSENELAHAPEL